VAGLFKDLKARGLLEDTLVIWTTEFGRMPFSQGSSGRDHNGGTFVTWLGGAGIKGGVSHWPKRRVGLESRGERDGLRTISMPQFSISWASIIRN
jgi:uncharacterized protein (DUF1501 family)